MKTVDVPLPSSATAISPDRRGRGGAGALRAGRSRSTTAARWTSSGARDGVDGQLYILQARPGDGEEPGSGQGRARATHLKAQRDGAGRGPRHRPEDRSRAGARWCTAPAEMDRVQAGDVLVTDMTDPNWEPVMKRAAAIVTNRGGRTCHAAIIARELGIPAVVGCGDATDDAEGRRAGHGVLRRGRHRLHLRRACCEYRGRRGAARRACRRSRSRSR